MPPSLLPGIWSNAVPRPRTALVEQVAGTYGVAGDVELEAKALQYINSAIDDANTHLWEFNKILDTGIAMVAGQPWVNVTANVYRESGCYLVNVATGVDPQRTTPLTMLPWIEYKRIYGTPNTYGTPMVYAYHNIHREGRIYLAPTPPLTGDLTTDYTLTFDYYRRIPHADEEDPLSIPREIETLIIYGAKKRAAMDHVGASHPDVTTYAGLETQAMDVLRGVDKRSPDERLRFRLAPRGYAYGAVPYANKLPYWWPFGG